MFNRILLVAISFYLISQELLAISTELIIICGFLILLIIMHKYLNSLLTTSLDEYSNNIFIKFKNQFEKIQILNNEIPKTGADAIKTLIILPTFK